jgi:hypothetical protein
VGPVAPHRRMWFQNPLTGIYLSHIRPDGGPLGAQAQRALPSGPAGSV